MSPERCCEIARAIHATVHGTRLTGNKGVCTGQVDTIVHVAQACISSTDSVRQVYRALVEDKFEDLLLMLREAKDKRRRGRAVNQSLTKQALLRLDELIQSELVKSEDSPGITCGGVAELCADHLHVKISTKTAQRILGKLGYGFGKLTTIYRLTSKRKKVIESFIIDFARYYKMEEEGKVVLVFTDESYLHAGHKFKKGWSPQVGKQYVVVNSAQVEQPGSAPPGFKDTREGDQAGGKGTRIIILNAISKDGMLCERGPSGKYLHKDQVYEPSRDSAITNAAWLWRAGKKGIPDYHDNMDSDGFMWWVKNRLVPAYRAVYQR